MMPNANGNITLDQFDENILPMKESDDKNHSNFSDPAFSRNKSYPIHRWVPWIAGFSKEFVNDSSLSVRSARCASGDHRSWNVTITCPKKPSTLCATAGSIPGISPSWMKKATPISSTGKKDMVIAGGYNIYPRDIEEVLFTHPKILEAAVTGIKDPYRGETLKAYVVLKEGEQLTEEEVIQFCRDNLAAYKVPKLVEFRAELPKTMVGKVLRRALREEEEKKAAK